MERQSLTDSILSKIDAKINLIVLNHVSESDSFDFESTLFKVFFITAVVAIVTGVTVDLFNI